MGDESVEALVAILTPKGNWATRVIPFTGVLTGGGLREKDNVWGPLFKGGTTGVEIDPEELPPPPPHARRVINIRRGVMNLKILFINLVLKLIEE